MLKLEFKISSKGNLLKVDSTQRFKLERLLSKKYVGELSQKIKEKIAKDCWYEIKRNYLEARKFDGSKVAKLKASTIKAKKHNLIFYNTGKLFKSILLRKIGNDFKIFIAPVRSMVAGYLQKGNRHMVARPAWGLSKQRLQQIVRKHTKNLK